MNRFLCATFDPTRTQPQGMGRKFLFHLPARVYKLVLHWAVKITSALISNKRREEPPMTQLFRVTLPILSLTVALLLGLSAVAFAQEITGNIVGTVKDVNGAAIKGATVTITDAATKQVVRTASTDDDGSFSARDLPVSTYNITVEASNLKKHVEANGQVGVGHRRAVEIGLEVGSVAEVVTVEASPLTVELATP